MSIRKSIERWHICSVYLEASANLKEQSKEKQTNWGMNRMNFAYWIVGGIMLMALLYWVNLHVTKSFFRMNIVSLAAISIVFLIIVVQLLYMFIGIADPKLNTDNKFEFTLNSLVGVVTLLGLYHVLVQNRMAQKQSETHLEIKKLNNVIFLLKEELNRCPERVKHNENLHSVKIKGTK